MTSMRSIRVSTWVLIVLIGLPTAALVIGEMVDAGTGAMPPLDLAAIIIWVTFLTYAIIGIFFLPTIVGICRGVDGLAIVVLLNVFLAWTLAGWVGALIRALGPTRAQLAASRSVATRVAPTVISPDGKHWWDGRAWQPMPGTTPLLPPDPSGS